VFGYESSKLYWGTVTSRNSIPNHDVNGLVEVEKGFVYQTVLLKIDDHTYINLGDKHKQKCYDENWDKNVAKFIYSPIVSDLEPFCMGNYEGKYSKRYSHKKVLEMGKSYVKKGH
jgi:hypothetical protein